MRPVFDSNWEVEVERPTPVIGDRIDLALPSLPEAMVGRRVLHLSDLHVRRYRPSWRRMIDALSRERSDFVFMTGDYVSAHGDERIGVRALNDLVAALSPEIGVFASFGNHDSPAFKRIARRNVGGVVWLDHEARALPELDLLLLGASTPCDVMASVFAGQDEERRLGAAPGTLYQVLLGHEPNALIAAAHFGIEWMLAGHTHGGQIRFPIVNFAPHNYSDLPGNLSSGILRVRDSICTISRGLGESLITFRMFCPTHAPLYVLERGPLPGETSRSMQCVKWW